VGAELNVGRVEASIDADKLLGQKSRIEQLVNATGRADHRNDGVPFGKLLEQLLIESRAAVALEQLAESGTPEEGGQFIVAADVSDAGGP
jgi:hypothetical protein